MLGYQKIRDTGWHFNGRPLGLILIVVYKFIWGSIEVLSGILLYFSSFLIARELVEDPQDLFVNWLLTNNHINLSAAKEFGIIIGLLGLGKVLIAFGIWYRSALMRDIGIAYFSLIGAYAIFSILSHFTIFKLLTLVADLAILYYLWQILPKHLKHGEIS